MSLKIANENLCINRIIKQSEESFSVECDEIVPDIKPDVLSIIGTNGNVCIKERDIQDGKIKLTGNINIYTLYVADDEQASIKCINSNLDFSKMIEDDNIKQKMQLEQKITIKSIDARVINGRKINLKVELCISFCIYSNDDISILKDVENVSDLQRLNKTCSINSLIGYGNTNAYAKDTLKIEKTDNLQEIIKVKTSITNKESKISYNKVLAKADLNVKVVYITDENKINNASITIPVMGFVDVQNANENNICESMFNIKYLNIKPNNIEEHSIYIESEIGINCSVYETKEIQLIEDLYSPSKELEYSQSNIKVLKSKKNLKQICNIRSQDKITEIGKNRIYDVEITPIILNREISNGRIVYEGNIILTFLFGPDENMRTINSKTITKPFNFNVVDDEIKEDTRIENSIEIMSQDFIVMPDESIDIRVDLEFDLEILNSEKINIINEIKEAELQERERYSIIIYYTKPGDTLWNIAKKFGSTIDDIVKVNNIEDEDKIMIGEQLFIPR